jgi:hypothetical protein
VDLITDRLEAVEQEALNDTTDQDRLDARLNRYETVRQLLAEHESSPFSRKPKAAELFRAVRNRLAKMVPLRHQGCVTTPAGERFVEWIVRPQPLTRDGVVLGRQDYVGHGHMTKDSPSFQSANHLLPEHFKPYPGAISIKMAWSRLYKQDRRGLYLNPGDDVPRVSMSPEECIQGSRMDLATRRRQRRQAA